MYLDYGITFICIDIPLPDTQTRGCTASGSRVGQDRVSTAPSEKGTVGRRPEKPEPPTAVATSYLESKKKKKGQIYLWFSVDLSLDFYISRILLLVDLVEIG